MAVTIAAYYREQYRPQRLLGRAPATLREYDTALGHWTIFPGSVPLSKVTTAVFAEFLAWRLAHSTPTTVNKHRRHLLAILRHAHKNGKSKLPDVPAIPEVRRLPEAWTRDDLERIVVAARRKSGMITGMPAGGWWSSLILCQYSAGCRIGPLLQLAPTNLSLSGRYMVLEAATQKHRVPEYRALSDQAVAAVSAIYSADRDRVWPWPLCQRSFFRHFRNICKAAGVRHGQGAGGLTHKIRRTSGTLVAANGGLIDAQQHLGHSSAAVTRDHYIDPRIARTGQLDKLPVLRLDEPSTPACSAWSLD